MFSFSSALQKKAQAISLILPADRVYLRPATMDDFETWVRVRQDNRAHLTPFEPEWPKDVSSHDFFKRRIERLTTAWERDQTYAFLLFLKDKNRLIGGVNLNNIARGSAQHATLGYWLDQGHQGQGLMTQGVGAAIDFAFYALQLARINAGSLPRNHKSRSLLTRLGFIEEGFAKAYIQINGVREDHVLYGLNKDDYLGMAHKA